MPKDHLLAGEFGAAARLSPKALRLYAEQGLLVPARTDPLTGYRYYSPDQVLRARLIARLRRLGLPLARIGQLADLPDEARMIELRGWLRSERDALDERVALVEAVDRYADGSALIDAVRLREIGVVYEGSVEPSDDLHIRLAVGGCAAYLPVPGRFADFR